MTAPAPFLDRLRLGNGFTEQDRPRIVEAMGSLPRHLARWEPDQVELEVRVNDRGGDEQKVSMEAHLPGWPLLIATAHDRDLDRALRAARHDLVRQIEDRKDLEKPPKGRARRPA
jgi:ribosome-associated translation inhibitor RaiA